MWLALFQAWLETFISRIHYCWWVLKWPPLCLNFLYYCVWQLVLYVGLCTDLGWSWSHKWLRSEHHYSLTFVSSQAYLFWLMYIIIDSDCHCVHLTFVYGDVFVALVIHQTHLNTESDTVRQNTNFMLILINRVVSWVVDIMDYVTEWKLIIWATHLHSMSILEHRSHLLILLLSICELVCLKCNIYLFQCLMPFFEIAVHFSACLSPLLSSQSARSSHEQLPMSDM